MHTRFTLLGYPAVVITKTLTTNCDFRYYFRFSFFGCFQMHNFSLTPIIKTEALVESALEFFEPTISATSGFDLMLILKLQTCKAFLNELWRELG